MKNFISFIKEYSTRDFIYFFSEESIAIFKKQMRSPTASLNCCITFPFNAILHGFQHKQVPVMLSAWDIQTMAYLSVVNANDYRKKVMDASMAGTVANLYRGYEDDKSKSSFIKEAEITDIFKFLMGMTYEQFKYQNPSWIFQNFNRNYHMLIGADKINREKIIDFNIITKDLFGLDVDEFLTVGAIIIWLCCIHPNPLDAPEELYRKKNKGILIRSNLERIIDYYTVSYDEVRNSPLERQLFYSKPFVKTQKTGETIAVSFYLVLMLMADGLYWLIRDYYRNHGWGQKFVNVFGKMFEEYFEEIANIYLPQNAWRRIPEQKGKSADYFVEFDNAIFLFELKSGIMGIGAKQQNPNLGQIDTFYDRNIREAYKQLKASEGDYHGTKPVIKIFLLYESMTNTQMVVPSIPEIFDVDKKCCVMTIENWEMMLVTYKNDIDKFNQITKAMIEDEGDLHVNVLNILNDYEVIGNMHFVEERDYVNRIIKKLEIELR